MGMKAYSIDLREKILDAYDHGFGSQRALAGLFGVSRSFVEKLLQRRRTTGEIAPRPHAGGRQPRCDAATLALVRQWVRENPDATLEELAHQLQEQCRLRVSVSTISRLLTRAGLPRKKSHSTPARGTPSASSTHVPATGSVSPRSTHSG
jgi:transposase